MNEFLKILGISTLIEIFLFLMLYVTSTVGYGEANEGDIPEMQLRAEIQSAARLKFTFIYALYHLPFILLFIFMAMASKLRIFTWILLFVTPITYTLGYSYIKDSWHL